MRNMSNLRKEVQWFAEEMENKLASKDGQHPEGWQGDSTIALFKKLERKVEDLGETSIADGESVKRLAVDVANFAMMIADNARKFTTE